MEGRQQSQKLMDYELMQEVFNRVPSGIRPGGKYGLIAGLGYSGDYPTKGDVTTPRQFGQKVPGKPLRTMGVPGGRAGGFYTLKGSDPSTQATMRDRGLFPLGNFPEEDQVYYQDILNSEQYGKVNNFPEKTILHEFFHRGSQILPLDDLIQYAEEKNDDTAVSVFQHMKSPRGQHKILEALDVYVRAEGDEDRIPGYLVGRLRAVEKANKRIREYMTPKKQKELGLRIPLQESKPKKKGLFDRFFK